MSYFNFATRDASLVEDAFAQYPDAGEQTLLKAVRTWLRPQCDSLRRDEDWRKALFEVGVTADGVSYFDGLMRSLMLTSCRRVDIRCRCATELAKDEASLLQIVALLQQTNCDAASGLLKDWVPEPTVVHILKLAQLFAEALRDIGFAVQPRTRRVTYMH